MSRIRRIVIGSADPYAGSIRLIEKDEYLKQKGISVVFEHGKVEELCFALHYISLKRVLKPHHAIFNRLQNRYLSYTKKMDELIDSSRLILGSEQIRKSRLMAVLGY